MNLIKNLFSRLLNKIFVTPDINDQFDRSAGIRDGLMSILIGIAARKSIESNKPVKIKDLIDLKPLSKRSI